MLRDTHTVVFADDCQSCTIPAEIEPDLCYLFTMAQGIVQEIIKDLFKQHVSINLEIVQVRLECNLAELEVSHRVVDDKLRPLPEG